MRFPFVSKNLSKILGIVVLVAVVLSPSIYFYFKYREVNNLLHVNSDSTQKEDSALIAKVGQLFALPVNEEPTVATVADKNKLKDNPLFSKAENGDKVLIYKVSRKLFLYRPSINKLIDVAYISINQNTTNAVLESSSDHNQ
ncbi:MAG TPA: hypothetical protein VLI92_01260 [Candidatus Saccharimonadales bacterium]|nr:hypothetical protein [Candidatus Saccharimonadales bacterium]